MATQGTNLDEHHFHGGPFAGEFLDRAQLPDAMFRDGYLGVQHGRHFGRYVRDEGSAGGRDWDWEPA